MDHRLMSLAKAIIAELIDNDELPEINTCEILSSRLPSPYSGRSVEARQCLIQEGFIKKAKATNLDRITEEAIQYIKSSGEDYLKTAKIMLETGIDAENIADQDSTISEALWDNPEKNRRIIQEKISQKRSYGKKRSIQVKVSMSDEEVKLIDWLGKQGYGLEGSRSATLRKAISDVAKLIYDLQITNINNLAAEIISSNSHSNDEFAENKEIPLPQSPDQRIFLITDPSHIKQNIQAAIKQNRESYIFCLEEGEYAASLASKMDSLLEGISMVYEGEIKKINNDFIAYKISPQDS